MAAAKKDSLMLIEIPSFKPMAKSRVPKKMGSVADMYWKTKQTRLALEKQVALLKEQESLLRNHVIDNLPKSNATGVSGSLANVRSVPKTTLRAVDWEKVYKYIKRHDAFEMLQKRLANTAVQERMDAAGKRGVPGIEESGYVDISLTKVS